jgi:hypothetical protein
MMERLPDAMDGCSAKKMGEEMEDEEEMNKDYMTTVGLLLGVVGLVCTWCVYRPSYSYSSHYKGLLLHETAQASRAGGGGGPGHRQELNDVMFINILYIL